MSSLNVSSDAKEKYFSVVTATGTAPVRFDQITDRNRELCVGSNYGRRLTYIECRIEQVTQKVVERFVFGMSTHDIDMLTVSVCASMSSYHRDYTDLAARIVVNDLHKNTSANFLSTMNSVGKERLSDDFLLVVARAGDQISEYICYERDYNFTYFGIQTMQRSYLMRARVEPGSLAVARTIERPQHTYMRVALGICCVMADGRGHAMAENDFQDCLERAFNVYDCLSSQRLTHASPTMFNAGGRRAQLSSCFLFNTDDDLESLLQVDKDACMVSRWAGGVGISLTPVRAEGAVIRSTGGRSGGLRDLIVKFNASQRYVQQGGLRPGAFALYLETWHSDIFTFIEMGRFKGGGVNAPDLKYALWVSDLFMEAVKAELADSSQGDWHLFSPDVAPGLDKCHGEEFRALYSKYVCENKFSRVVKASEIVKSWYRTVAEKGNPYVLFKDHINNKSNLSHYATIASSNLCAEIIIPSIVSKDCPEKNEYGVCNLAALPLASFMLRDGDSGDSGSLLACRIDWKALWDAAGTAVRNLDSIIDINFYPVEACRRSNFIHRPVAVGVIGLADVFLELNLEYGSSAAQDIDAAIHAVIYHGAMHASSVLGRLRGNFGSFPGSAAQRGLLQPDLWVAQGHLGSCWEDSVALTTGGFLSSSSWASLRSDCSQFLRNGYVTADMPTATSSQVTGQNECFEPYTANLYTRKTLAGEFTLLNPHLLRRLEALGLWDEQMRSSIVLASGSVQNISRVPGSIRRMFRTARELDQRVITEHAASRNPFLSQTQSLNYYFGEPVLEDALSVLMLGWERGLTTGSYYMHTQPATGAFSGGVGEGGGGGGGGGSLKKIREPCPAECDSCAV
jgi:ribonucleoside-diphosphate reductase subunit M1